MYILSIWLRSFFYTDFLTNHATLEFNVTYAGQYERTDKKHLFTPQQKKNNFKEFVTWTELKDYTSNLTVLKELCQVQ